MAPVEYAWFGKHPAHGDFVSRGMPDTLRDRMQDWLDGALGAWRMALGEGWADAFDSAPMVRFWIGAQVMGGGLSGIMVPSHDKVGRRYPLIVAIGGINIPPPLEPEQVLHDALADQIPAVLANPDLGSEITPAAPMDDVLWAMNATGQTETVLSDIAAEDMCRASQTRSYWWIAGSDADPARVLTVTGMPDGAALGWILSPPPAVDAVADTPAPVDP